jgi:hypothetical protein
VQEYYEASGRFKEGGGGGGGDVKGFFTSIRFLSLKFENYDRLLICIVGTIKGLVGW